MFLSICLLIHPAQASGPSLLFASTLGGSQWDTVRAIATDAARNIYLVGETYSRDFPATQAPGKSQSSTDLFVVKLTSSGKQIAYSILIGGSGNDSARAIAVDSDGNAFITGVTTSTDFPATPGAFQTASASPGLEEAFVVKVGPTGTIVYASYLGGNGSDTGSGIAIDRNGSAYIAGSTSSVDFKTTANAPQRSLRGATNCFISKFDSAGSALLYSTLLGGQGLDVCKGIATDETGAAFVTGVTNSQNFPVIKGLKTALSGQYDAFLTKLSPDGAAFLFSTYLGGDGVDEANVVRIDQKGTAYVGGDTTSASNFPITDGAFQEQLKASYDGFLFAIANDGSRILLATYLGGSGTDSITDLSVTSGGQIVAAGYTSSLDLAVVNPVQTFGGYLDGFVALLNGNVNAVDFCTYIGGGGDDRAYAVIALENDAFVVAGQMLAASVPYVSGTFSSGMYGQYDGFVMGAFYAPTAVSVGPATAVLNSGQTKSFSAAVSNASTSSVLWSISPADAGTLTVSGNTAIYQAPASVPSQQKVTIMATSVADTTKTASASITVNPAAAFTAISIFNTGMAPGGGLLADGAVDPHYKLISSADPKFPGPNAIAIQSNAFPIPPWLGNGPNSRWIGPQSNQGIGNAQGTYTYRTSFDLAGLDPATASLSVRVAADNAVTVKLNGTAVFSASGFSSFTTFQINTGFSAGVNTLDFVVTNDIYTPNPTGLRVEISGTATPSSSAAITIFNTGVAAGGGLLADGAVDPHYKLISSADPSFPGPNAIAIQSNAFPIPPWLGNGPNSKWIGPQSNQGFGNAQGTYTYRTTFDLTGLDPATASLSVRVAADNAVTIKLNGTAVFSASGFSSFTSFQISTGFTAGVNTLDFVVTNDIYTPNPTGLRVEISGTATPSSSAGITIFNTGVAADGGLLADGAVDPHYKLISSADPSFPGPNAPGIQSNAFPIPPWLGNGPNSKWIGPQSNQGFGNAQGTYTYRTTFDLTGLDSATASLNGQVAADNAVTIKLNGMTVFSASGFSSFTPFQINTGFTAGVNTLDFVVTNDIPTPNPTGLRVEITGTAKPS